MTVIALPKPGRWVWDARDRTRALRVSPHPERGLLNLSLWRDDVCVGTVKLRPDEVSGLVSALSDGLARLATPPATPVHDADVVALETRPAAAGSRPTVERSRPGRLVRSLVGQAQDRISGLLRS